MFTSSSNPFWDVRIFRCRDHVDLQGEQCETESEWSGNKAKEYNEADFKVEKSTTIVHSKSHFQSLVGERMQFFL